MHTVPQAEDSMGCIVCSLAMTVLYCVWHPNLLIFEYYKLACIMYLFDNSACGYSKDVASSVKNLRFSNDTMGLDVLPITWKPAYVTVSSRLSAKARGHIKISVVIHILWMLLAITAKFIKNDNNPKQLRYILNTMFYSCVLVVIFDLSMAIVYVTHIKQSLTKGMIIRYSGWSADLKKNINHSEFGGWLPISASILWMKGAFIVAFNMYFCRTLYYLSHNIRKKDIIRRFLHEHRLPIPEPRRDDVDSDHILFFRPGELKPDTKRDLGGSYY